MIFRTVQRPVHRRLLSLTLWSLTGLAALLPRIQATADEPEALFDIRASQTAGSEETSSEQLRETVLQLVRELDADRFSVRRQAEQRLLELGPPVLKWLPDEAALPTASQRLAVRRIRTALQQRLARDRLLPRRVRLKGTYRLEEILQHLQRSTGNRVDYVGDARRLDTTIAVDFDGAPLLECLDRLCARTALLWRTDGTLGRAVVSDPPAGGSPIDCLAVAYPSLFRVCCPQVVSKRLPDADTHRLLQTTLVVVSEPRIRPLFMMVGLKDFTARAIAEDGARCELTPFDPEAVREITFGGTSGTATFALDWIADPAPLRAVEVSGVLRPLVAAEQQRFEFDLSGPDVAPRSARFGPVRVQLRSVRFVATTAGRQSENQRTANERAVADNEPAARGEADRAGANGTGRGNVAGGSVGPAGTLYVRLLVNYGVSGPAFESHRTWLYHNRVYIQRRGAANRPIRPAPSFRTGLNADGLLEVQYAFPLAAPPTAGDKLVYFAPVLLTELTVPVRLTVPIHD